MKCISVVCSAVVCTTNGRAQPDRSGPNFLSQKTGRARPGLPGKSVERAGLGRVVRGTGRATKNRPVQISVLCDELEYVRKKIQNHATRLSYATVIWVGDDHATKYYGAYTQRAT
jgi:hypothetical protein